MSQCVVNVQGQAHFLPAVPRRRDCSQLKACFVQALPKWQIGLFKKHCTGERRGNSLFSLSQPFAVRITYAGRLPSARVVGAGRVARVWIQESILSQRFLVHPVF